MFRVLLMFFFSYNESIGIFHDFFFLRSTLNRKRANKHKNATVTISTVVMVILISSQNQFFLFMFILHEMIFLFIFLFISRCVHSKLLTYTLHQTDHICSHNWKASICLSILHLDRTTRPLTIKLDQINENFCHTQNLIYIRSRSCIYCPIDFNDIHCHRQRFRRHDYSSNPSTVYGRFPLKTIGLIGCFTLLIAVLILYIKRTPAQTNLIPLQQQSTAPIITQPHRPIDQSLPINVLPRPHPKA